MQECESEERKCERWYDIKQERRREREKLESVSHILGRFESTVADFASKLKL